MWKSTSLQGKWLAAAITALAVTLAPWWLSAILVVASGIWFTKWYQGLLPVLWFDILYGSPIHLNFYPGEIPLTALMAIFIILVAEVKVYFRFQS